MDWIKDLGDWAFGDQSLAKGAYDWAFGEGSLINEGYQELTGENAAEAAAEAAEIQEEAAEKGISEQQRQFDVMTDLLSDYVGIGKPALDAMGNLAGIGDPEAQAQAINQIKQGPEFQALTEQGEEAILANAAATGGLRGGDVQGMLAQYRPSVLSNLIDKQYSRLGGLTQLGQSSAARTGAQGMQFGQNVSNLYGDIGAYQSGGVLGQQQARSQGLGNLGGLIGRGGAALFSGGASELGNLSEGQAWANQGGF